MIGRLGMDVKECIESYKKLSKAIFGQPKHQVKGYMTRMQGSQKEWFDQKALRAVVEAMVFEKTGHKDTPLYPRADEKPECSVQVHPSRI
jgi:hypothetical protein